MANTFGTDILIQAPDPAAAARFYVESLGFEITDTSENMISLHGRHINMFIERGEPLGPILEVFVDNVELAKRRLTDAGCVVIRDEPQVPRVYVRDLQGLTYNLST